MKQVREFFTNTVVGGMLVVLPLYLAVLLLLKAVQAVVALIRPLAELLPAWAPTENLLALLILLAGCACVGFAVRTQAGRALRERVEESFFGKLPGYNLFRSLTQQFAGKAEGMVWKPALAEIEDALVPAFIVEELGDSGYTVFVPSSPTPFAGAVYILDRSRVHPIDIPFTQAIRSISQWGAGTKDLLAAMQKCKARPVLS